MPEKIFNLVHIFRSNLPQSPICKISWFFILYGDSVLLQLCTSPMIFVSEYAAKTNASNSVWKISAKFPRFWQWLPELYYHARESSYINAKNRNYSVLTFAKKVCFHSLIVCQDNSRYRHTSNLALIVFCDVSASLRSIVSPVIFALHSPYNFSFCKMLSNVLQS